MCPSAGNDRSQLMETSFSHLESACAIVAPVTRWTERPEGSTWGDWGDDDELGRINLITPREGAAGRGRGAGGPDVLPQPPARLSRRHRAEPAPPSAAPGADRGHGRHARRLLQRPHERDARLRRPEVRRRVGRRRRHAVACSTRRSGTRSPTSAPSSTPTATASRRPSITTATAPGSTSSARPTTRAATAAGTARFAHHLGLEHMAFHGVQGRGVLVDLHHHLGDDVAAGRPRRCSQEIMAADNVVVEPGDMLLLHTGLRHPHPRVGPQPDPRKLFTTGSYLDALRRRAARLDRATRRSARSSPTTTRSRDCSARTRTRRATRSCRSTTCACSSSACRSARCGSSTSSRRSCRANKPKPLPPDRSPAAPPRHRRRAGHTYRHRVEPSSWHTRRSNTKSPMAWRSSP